MGTASWRQTRSVEARCGVPGGDRWGPLFEVGPDQVAELLDLELGVFLGAEVEEVHQSAEGEADNKVLADVEGKHAAGMFFRKAQG